MVVRNGTIFLRLCKSDFIMSHIMHMALFWKTLRLLG